MSNRLERKSRPERSERDPDYVAEEEAEEVLFQETSQTGIDFDIYEDIPVDIKGENIPPPIVSFEEIDGPAAMMENIKRAKFSKLTPIQKYSIPIALSGRDVMSCAQTGSGKTAAYLFPIITSLAGQKKKKSYSKQGLPRALILAPTRELCVQIYNEARKFAFGCGLKSLAVYGGVSINAQIERIKQGVDILVATPGRLLDLVDREWIAFHKIRWLVFDEADRMLDMGFEKDIRAIVDSESMPSREERTTMMFSATFPTEIRRLAKDYLRNYVFITIGRVGSTTELITQKILHVRNFDKTDKLLELLREEENEMKKTLIFVETKSGCDELEGILNNEGFKSLAIHGDKSQAKRDSALRAFKTGQVQILIATDVASRGLDINDVAHVINYDMPKNIDSYIHRIGRTGRVGKKGLATSFYNRTSDHLAKELITVLKESKQEVPDFLERAIRQHKQSPHPTKQGYQRRGFNKRREDGFNQRDESGGRRSPFRRNGNPRDEFDFGEAPPKSFESRTRRNNRREVSDFDDYFEVEDPKNDSAFVEVLRKEFA